MLRRQTILSMISALMLISVNLYAQQKSLPHFMTDKEKQFYKSYQAPLADRGNPSPPPEAVRGMAEWEELDGLMITWTSYYDILTDIIDYAQEEGKVYIVCSDSNQVKNYLSFKGVPLKNLKFLIEAYDTIWCRDYGPWTAYSEENDSLFIIDWIYNRPRPNDDVIPSAFADYISVPEYETSQSPNDLVHTGGNLMVDGQGTAFSSELILDENSSKSEAEIDGIMHDYLGVQRYIKMTVLPFDEIHHIDMHMKLLDEETLLVGEYPQGVADGPQIEANLQYILDNFNTCYGNPYKVVRIPMPPDAMGRYPDQGGDYRTYTNSVIVNKTVIVPTYEEQYDTTALRIYREAMPGYKIVGIDCNEIIPSLGAIHCITKEVGARKPVFIAHNPLWNTTVTEEPVTVNARIQSLSSTIDSAFTYWSTDTSAGFIKEMMQATQNDTFTVQLPSQSAGTEVYYYISAVSADGKRISKPLVAPAGLFSYSVQSPSLLQSRNELAPRSIALLQNYPNPFGGRSPRGNPRTTLRYKLNQAQVTTLEIYNSAGQKVRTLRHGFETAGEKNISWDGSNSSGMRVSAGVYIYRLQGKIQSLSGKMLFLP